MSSHEAPSLSDNYSYVETEYIIRCLKNYHALGGNRLLVYLLNYEGK